jgi:hypothetical protein
VIEFLGRLPTRLVLETGLDRDQGLVRGPPALKSDSMANRCHRAVPAFCFADISNVVMTGNPNTWVRLNATYGVETPSPTTTLILILMLMDSWS